MTLDDLAQAFNDCDDDFLQFGLVQEPLSQRADLAAFMLLDKLIPGDDDIISSSHHDEYYLSITAEQLAAVATPAIIRELVRCGIRYDESTESLCLFA